jgi:hypothetical protein
MRAINLSPKARSLAMKNPLLVGVILTISIAAVFVVTPFSVREARSQTRTVRPIDPVPITPVPVTPKPVPITPVPNIVLAPTVTAPVPRVEAVPHIVLAPIVNSRVRAVVPGPGPSAERESSDCTVHEFSCAEACDPLPEGWSSYRQCVSYQCKEVNTNCLEKLAEELGSRGEITFKVECQSKYKIQIGFYSKDRNVAWPGNERAYNIDDYKTHVYKLRCNSGEKICYGAWQAGGSEYWGAGFNARHACRGCCAPCDGRSVSYVLQ